ncbi:MAG: hypothetical protein JWR83_1958 [Aeromicrobium sp.]|nr:hypothetical protein [Aeromicrobium sp.]
MSIADGRLRWGLALPTPAPGDPWDQEVGRRLTEVLECAEIADADFAIIEDRGGRTATGIDPVSAASFGASGTSGVGLIPTVDVTYGEPYHTANALATLDFVTAGRAAWQPVVDLSGERAARSGVAEALPGPVLYERATEFCTIVRDLWSSWDEDAVVRDQIRHQYLDTARLRTLDFVGRHLTVRGPAMTPRPPQGRLLTFLSVSAHPTEDELRFVAATADVLRLPGDLGGAEVLARRVLDAGPDRVVPMRFLLDIEVPTMQADVLEVRRTISDVQASALLHGVTLVAEDRRWFPSATYCFGVRPLSDVDARGYARPTMLRDRLQWLVA